MKVCSKCKIERELTLYRKRSDTGGLHGQCKFCMIEYRRNERKKLSVIKRKKKKEKQITDGEQYSKKYIGLQFGSFTITDYKGKYVGAKQTYGRHYFEKTCNFCGLTRIISKANMHKQVKNKTTCNSCKETVNIHTKQKKCPCCNEWKSATNEYFCINNGRKFGLDYYCTTCKNNKHREYRKDPDFRRKEYEQKTRRYKTDSLFKLTCAIRSNIKAYIIRVQPTRQNKKAKTPVILGCNYFQFREHIEKQFSAGMTWDNYGKWHLEHLIPASYGKTEDEVIELCHHTNYRPMWGNENISKGNKLYVNEISEENKIRYKKYIERYINSDLVRY
jgi:hypothetical protein